jgi:ferric-chelate reductase [NAD(P)H]
MMDLKTLNKLSYGMYIVSSKKDGKLNGQVANTVFQVTSNPPMIAVCVNKQNLTHECIMSKKAFSVSILSVEAPMTFMGKFGFKSGKDVDKFKDTKYKMGVLGVPIALDYAVAYLEAEVTGSMEFDSHTLFIGKIIGAENLGDQEPMTYSYYHLVKGGKTQKNAPTFNGLS